MSTQIISICLSFPFHRGLTMFVLDSSVSEEFKLHNQKCKWDLCIPEVVVTLYIAYANADYHILVTD